MIMGPEADRFRSLLGCAGHGTVLAGESPVMDNLPFM